MVRDKPCDGVRGLSSLMIRRFASRNVVTQLTRDLANNQIMENFFRNVVREEVERQFGPIVQSQRLSSNLNETSNEETTLQLRFINSLPKSIFTGSRIESEDGSPIILELIDSNTERRITSGPLSSSKIEIVPLDGDFSQEDWDEEQFKSSILCEREGRRPLLTGDLNLTLTEGLLIVNGDVVVTDNSSWIRSRRFRLGARVPRRQFREPRVKEARSRPFVCKDHRGESYKKHHPPFPADEVWRLEKISRDGVFHSRLTKFGIHTVKDFRRLYTIDPAMLRKILGDAGGVSNRVWEAIKNHSLDCVLDENERYFYNCTAHRACLLFNSVYEALAVAFDDFGFQHTDQLTYQQKLILDELKLEAYRNKEHMIGVGRQAFASPSRPLLYPQGEPSSLPNSGLHQIEFDYAHQDQQPKLINFSHNLGTETSIPAGIHQFEAINGFRTGDLPGNLSDGSQSRVVPMGLGETEDAAGHWFTSDWSSPPCPQTNGFHHSYDTEPEIIGMFPKFDVGIIRMGRSRGRWCKIRAALKLRSAWRYVAARRRAGIL